MKRMMLAATTLAALVLLLTVGSPSASAAMVMSIPVPDGGMTVMLLGGSLGCLEVLRRKLGK